jgi:hypothetical protein
MGLRISNLGHCGHYYLFSAGADINNSWSDDIALDVFAYAMLAESRTPQDLFSSCPRKLILSRNKGSGLNSVQSYHPMTGESSTNYLVSVKNNNRIDWWLARDIPAIRFYSNYFKTPHVYVQVINKTHCSARSKLLCMAIAARLHGYV